MVDQPPPKHMAHWSLQFTLNDRAKAEFARAGVPAPAIAAIERRLANLVDFLSTEPPSRRDQIKKLRRFQEGLRAALDAMPGDDLTESLLSAVAFGNWTRATGTLPPEGGSHRVRFLREALSVYEGAAGAMVATMERNGPKRGPDPEIPDRIARLVADSLSEAAVPIDDAVKGIYVVSVGIALEAAGTVLNIEGVSDVRNVARRVLDAR